MPKKTKDVRNPVDKFIKMLTEKGNRPTGAGIRRDDKLSDAESSDVLLKKRKYSKGGMTTRGGGAAKKGYKKGGKVRGAGCAQRGVRKVKIR